MDLDATSVAQGIASLVVGLGARACALPLAFVSETMRPLPLEALAGSPECVLGLSVVRGRPTPVVHLGRLLGSDGAWDASRVGAMRLDGRSLALAVDSVLGVRDLDPDELEAVPALLGPSATGAIRSVGRLDGQLLIVWRAGRLVTDGVWTALEANDRTAP